MMATLRSDEWGLVPNESSERAMVDKLLAEVRECPPIERERERELSRKIRAGLEARQRLQSGQALREEERLELEGRAAAGRDAKHELVTAHLPLVLGMARRYRWAPLSYLELIQEGSLGLLRAAEKFDWRVGAPFGAYASWWIRHAMSRAVRSAVGSVRLRDPERGKLRRLAEAREANPGAGAAELGEVAGVSGEDAESLVPLLGSSARVSTRPVGELIEELLADRAAEEELEEALVSADVARILIVADRVLSPRQRMVLEARYGLGGHEPQTLRQVAERLGVSVQRVSQIERSALDRLRAELATDPS
jgi:RNA polymerase primary sigma factor